MENKKIAELLHKIAIAYTIKDEKKFRFQIIAYQRAAEAIENEVRSVNDLYKENKLNTISGVGTSIQNHIQEYLKTGNVTHFDTVLKDVPESVYPLLALPSLGPKKAYKLVTAFHLVDPKTVISDLLKIAKEGKIAELENFGEKSQQEIIKTIEQSIITPPTSLRMPLPLASEMANQLIDYMKKCKDTKKIFPLGSLRRNVETIGDIDLGVATDNPKAVLDHFIAYPHKSRVLDRGEIGASFLANNGRRVDMKTQSEESFGALLQHFTGSKEHNVRLREIAIKKGLSLSEKGIKTMKTEKMAEYRTEEAFYNFLGMDWIPPEMRENKGEIELAQRKQLPKLVELKDIKGDLHIHSSFPMEESHDAGTSSPETMLLRAKELGYEYLAFSEHNPSMSKHAASDVVQLIKKRNEYLDKICTKLKNIRSIKMLETDILVDGRLAIDDSSLSLLDATIVSIHSSFKMSTGEMTERILKGLSHPKAKILAHPTGRLINIRQGYTADWEKIFSFCEKNNKALEINAFPSRLDLTDNLIHLAKRYKVKFSIDTDSHAVSHMYLMQYGVDVAKRGWLTKHDIINCMSYSEIMKWFKE